MSYTERENPCCQSYINDSVNSVGHYRSRKKCTHVSGPVSMLDYKIILVRLPQKNCLQRPRPSIVPTPAAQRARSYLLTQYAQEFGVSNIKVSSLSPRLESCPHSSWSDITYCWMQFAQCHPWECNCKRYPPRTTTKIHKQRKSRPSQWLTMHFESWLL